MSKLIMIGFTPDQWQAIAYALRFTADRDSYGDAEQQVHDAYALVSGIEQALALVAQQEAGNAG